MAADPTIKVRYNDGTIGVPRDSAPVRTLASATTLTLPDEGDVFFVSGTTAITSITESWPSRKVFLIFTGVLNFTDGGNLKLAGTTATTADDAILLVSDGTNWYQVAPPAVN